MTDNLAVDTSRRTFLKAAPVAAAAFALQPGGQTASAQDKQDKVLRSPLDKMFQPVEADAQNFDRAKVIQAQNARERAINDLDFLKTVKFEQADDGNFYPNFSKKNTDQIVEILQTYAKDGLGEDINFKTAVAFKGDKQDPKSNFRGRSFFVTDKPMNDGAKSVPVSFASEFRSDVEKATTPEGKAESTLSKNALTNLYKTFRDKIYRHMFRIGPNPKQPSGWHVFAQNGFRIDYKPVRGAKEGDARKGIFSIKNSYNMELKGEKDKDRMFIAGMGHNHIVLHQTSVIDSAEENGGGDFFERFMTMDPKQPGEGERHLPTHNHERNPASSVDIFDLAA